MREGASADTPAHLIWWSATGFEPVTTLVRPADERIRAGSDGKRLLTPSVGQPPWHQAAQGAAVALGSN